MPLVVYLLADFLGIASLTGDLHFFEKWCSFKKIFMKKDKVAIIGCGNIGLSLLQGLLKENIIPPENITVTRRNIQELAYLEVKGIKAYK